MTRRPVRVRLRPWVIQGIPEGATRLSVVVHAGTAAIPLTAQQALAVADQLVDAAEKLIDKEGKNQ